MLLPTKGISAERALITVGSELLEILETPRSVSELWELLAEQNRKNDEADRITFDWFSLATACLFSINLCEWTPSGHLRRRNVH